MKFKICFVLLGLVLCCSFGLSAQTVLTVDDVDFNPTYGAITAYKGSATDIVIPSHFTINGEDVAVLEIGNNAFASKNLTSVVISSGVTYIAYYAFGNNAITSLTIPNTVGLIVYAAFNENAIVELNGEPSNGLIYARNVDGSVNNTKIISYGGVSKNIDFIPETVTTIGLYAFHKQAITNVVLPQSLKEIEKFAFAFNDLSTVNFPVNINSIGESAFYHNQLQSIDLPNSLTVLGAGSFNVNRIQEVNQSVSKGIIYARNLDGTIDDSKIVSFGGLTSQIDFIPVSVKTIDKNAFTGNILESVVLPSNIEVIESYAFDKCELNSVRFENNSQLLLLGSKAFDNNKSLVPFSLPTNVNEGFSGFYVDENNNKYAPGDLITDYTKSYTAKVRKVLTIADVEFDLTTGTITNYTGTHAEISIPSSFSMGGMSVSVNKIGPRAFKEKGLKSVEISSGIYEVEDNAFEKNALVEVVLPGTLTSIGIRAFDKNEIIELQLPEGLVSIDEFAFRTNKIKSLYLPNSLSQIGKGAFNDNAISTLNGEVSKGIVFARGTNGREDQSSIVSYGGTAKNIDFIPASVTTISSSSFSSNQLQSVIIPEGVRVIEDGAFSSNLLTSVAFPSTLEVIEIYAFYSNQLKGVVLPNSLVHIGLSAFLSNTGLTSIQLPTHSSMGSLGWINKANKTYSSGALINEFNTEYRIPGTAYVKYKLNGGTNHASNVYAFLSSEGISTLYDATLSGDEFMGWYDGENNLVTSIPVGTVDNVTLHAKWKSDTYTVTFLNYNGALLKEEKVSFGQSATAPNEPVKIGSVFNGWDVAFNYVVSDVVITATFIDDTSVEENAIGLGWYPNPAQEYIILQGEYVGYLDFYNVSGVLIKQVFVSSNHQFIDVSDLNKGLYVIKAKNWCSRLVIK